MWQIQKLGCRDYTEILDLQYDLVNQKQNGLNDNFFLLLEHESVFTMGKGADKKNILDKNISIITINRGGDLTYHGPGQLIGYIIMDLKSNNLDLHQYLRKLEELIIRSLNDIEINAYRIEGLTGVWVKNKKIASIGIGVKRGITMHGFALNINTDISYFSKIKPCGLDSKLITSVQNYKNCTLEYFQELVIRNFQELFDINFSAYSPYLKN